MTELESQEPVHLERSIKPQALKSNTLPIFSHAFGGPLSTAVLKNECEDFVVDEELPFELDGSGEHVYLKLKKRDKNTHDLVRLLQSAAKVAPVAVGYCGLKDKRAVTSQWFSVHCGVHANPDWSELVAEGVEVLLEARHSKKLRIGTHKQNSFNIILRQVVANPEQLGVRLEQIAESGFPNYFGEQRFGINGANLPAANAMFERFMRGSQKRFKPRRKDQIYLSAARSLLFNAVLSARVQSGSWDTRLEGDVFQFDDGSSVFRAGEDDALAARLSQGSIHPTAAMFGKGGIQPEDRAAALEQEVLQQYPTLCDGLLAVDMSAARRATRAIPRDFTWEYTGSDLQLQFNLKRGTYATSLIREIVQATTP
ncbi:MAG: tRNA pseudouridine(13) synthase TruD [Pseudomonadales bacterium]